MGCEPLVRLREPGISLLGDAQGLGSGCGHVECGQLFISLGEFKAERVKQVPTDRERDFDVAFGGDAYSFSQTRNDDSDVVVRHG